MEVQIAVKCDTKIPNTTARKYKGKFSKRC